MAVETCPPPSELEAFLVGRADEARQAAMEAHVLACPSCADRLRTLSGGDTVTDALKATGTHVPRSPALEKLIARLKANPPGEPKPAPSIEATGVQDPVAKSAALSRPVKAVPEGDWLPALLAPPESPEAVGTLGPYQVLKILGKGGMGAVLLAEDPRLARRVALKVLLPEVASRQDMKERFLREARLAAQLEHDNVVGIYQVGEDRGVPFIAMQFLKGAPLDEWLKARKRENPVSPVKPSVILKLGREIAQGLAAAHARGLIHRDIKPANVWLDASAKGRVRLLDFGLARSAGSGGDHQLTQTGTVMGTPAYMSPEQARGKEVDHRSDLFSLGGVLYVLCTGHLPFTGSDTMSILTSLAVDTPTPPRARNPEIPAALSDLVMKLLSKDPAGRYQTADEVVRAIQALERAGAEKTSPAVAPAAPAAGDNPWADIEDGTSEVVESPRPAASGIKPPTKKGGAAKWVAAAAGAIFLLAAGVVFFLPGKDGTLRVEIDDPEIEVSIKGTAVVLKKADGGKDLSLEPGEKSFKVTRGDFSFETDKFSLKRGEKTTVRVEWLPGKVQVVQDGKVIGEKAVATKPKPKEKLPETATDPDPVRAFALSVLDRGGRLYVRAGDKSSEPASRAELPKEPFKIERVHLVGERVAKHGDDLFEGIDFTPYAGWLEIGSPTLTDAGLAKLPRAKGSGRIDNLNFINSPKVTDAGLAELAKLEGLAEIGLSHVPVKGTGFADFGKAIWRVTVNRAPLTPEGVAAIAKLPGVKDICLIDVNATPAQHRALAGSRAERLFLEHLGDEALTVLADLPNLKEIHCSYDQFTPKAVETLKKMKGLTLAELHYGRLSKDDFQALSDARPDLKIVSSHGNFPAAKSNSNNAHRELAKLVLDKGGVVYFELDGKQGLGVNKSEELPKRPFRVYFVYLKGPTFGAMGDDPFANFDLTGVVDLIIELPTFGDAGMANLLKVPGAGGLLKVGLKGTRVTDVGLAELAKLPELKELDLMFNRFDGTGFKALAGLTKFTQITMLGHPLSAEGVAAVGKLPHLTYLNLGYCKLTPKHLEGLVGCKLDNLILHDTELTDEGAAHVTKIDSLRNLSCPHTRITGKGLQALAKLPNLTSLDVMLTPNLKEADVKAFVAARPKVKVTSDFGTFEPK